MRERLTCKHCGNQTVILDRADYNKEKFDGTCTVCGNHEFGFMPLTRGAQ